MSYSWIYCPEHPSANNAGSVHEHIIVVERKIGRRLLKDEEVHHIDEDTHNNDPANLQILSHRDHTRIHRGWSMRDGNWWKTCRKCNQFLHLSREIFPRKVEESV